MALFWVPHGLFSTRSAGARTLFCHKVYVGLSPATRSRACVHVHLVQACSNALMIMGPRNSDQENEKGRINTSVRMIYTIHTSSCARAMHLLWWHFREHLLPQQSGLTRVRVSYISVSWHSDVHVSFPPPAHWKGLLRAADAELKISLDTCEAHFIRLFYPRSSSFLIMIITT